MLSLIHTGLGPLPTPTASRNSVTHATTASSSAGPIRAGTTCPSSTKLSYVSFSVTATTTWRPSNVNASTLSSWPEMYSSMRNRSSGKNRANWWSEWRSRVIVSHTSSN